MALYPSLEDMKVDEMAHAQLQIAGQPQAAPPQGASATSATSSPYGSIMSEMDAEMGYGDLDISSSAMQQYMPVDHIQAWKASYQPLATITTPSDMSVVQKATIKQGVRPVTLAKDGNGKLGVALDAWDKGVFVAFVWQGSSAALGGVRFGDQILQIDGQDVAGWTAKKAMTALRNGSPSGVTLAIRDRPMMRPLTIQKDATNHCGFLFKDGEITSIVKDSSAARNGMLIHHQIIEINAQCTVGLKDKELLQIIQESPPTITITITPRFVYKHLIKKIGFSSLKKYMNHGVPEY